MIGIDVSLAVGEKAGVGYYAASLIEALAKIDRQHDYMLYPFFGNTMHPDFKKVTALATGNFRVFMDSASPSRVRLTRIKFGIDNSRYFNGIDLLHCTSFFIPKQYSGPIISTIYDVSFLLFPECHTEANRLYCLQGTLDAADRCDRIIAISENTKSDLIKYFAVEPERVVVTHLAPRDVFRPINDELMRGTVLKKYGIKGSYIFSLGSIEPRKNLIRLIRAYALLDERTRGRFSLVIAGGTGWLNSDIYAEVKELNLSDYVKFIGYIVDEDLPVLYSAADMFVYPSLYEGFGLPVVEAMACGAPVITSNNSSLREIAKGAALLIDPIDETAIANAILDIINDRELANDLRAKSIIRSSEFSWLEAARKTLAVYEACIR
ncbi:MAG: glycosyltransferase family 4 protein [Actinobacteria bacterium]|nr:glycosyltransferase family 4 protein [Actinomycetota bacterium]